MMRDCTAFLTHPPCGVAAVSRFRIRTVGTMYSHRHSPRLLFNCQIGDKKRRESATCFQAIPASSARKKTRHLRAVM